MKLFLLALAVTGVLAAPQAQYHPIDVDYHGLIGIPEAARIKAAEEAMDFDGARVAGGGSSRLGQFPYMGGLLITLSPGMQSVCGSALITHNRVLTAAHCWTTPQHQGTSVTVVLGSVRLFSGGVRLISSNVQVHEQYNMNSRINDVAIIVVNSVLFTDNVKAINLAAGNYQYVGEVATAIGFGKTGDAHEITNSQTLSHVELEVVPNSECLRSFGQSRVLGSTLCVSGARGKSVCSGDTGGPLVVNDILIGITSFHSAVGCEQGVPSGYARISAFHSWISARM